MKKKIKGTGSVGSKRMKERGKTQVSIYLNEMILYRLDRLASKEGSTRAGIAARLIADFFKAG